MSRIQRETQSPFDRLAYDWLSIRRLWIYSKHVLAIYGSPLYLFTNRLSPTAISRLCKHLQCPESSGYCNCCGNRYVQSCIPCLWVCLFILELIESESTRLSSSVIFEKQRTKEKWSKCYIQLHNVKIWILQNYSTYFPFQLSLEKID